MFWHLFSISRIKLFIQVVLQNSFSTTIFKELMLTCLFRCMIGSYFSLILRRCHWPRQIINLGRLMNDKFQESSHGLIVVLAWHLPLRTVEYHTKLDPVWLASTNLWYYQRSVLLVSNSIQCTVLQGSCRRLLMWLTAHFTEIFRL
jgi:hypothetical protein